MNRRQLESLAAAVSIKWKNCVIPANSTIDTPFGPPSDALVGGKLSGRQVYFLPRHGRGHRILPHEINHRANIYALRSLNVRWIISVAAVGSLQEKYAPRDVLLPSQFYDRTSRRAAHTFFGEGIAAHIAFAEPISTNLRNLLAESARSLGVTVHNGGTYVNMDGPAFSTRAESELNRRNGFDVIGDDKSYPRRNWRVKRRSHSPPWP